MKKPNLKRAKELEAAVERALQIYGYKFHRVTNYRCYKCGAVQNSKAKGFPDFFCYYPNVIAIEVKTGKGRLTAEQKETKMYMEISKIDYLVVRDTIDELLKYLEENVADRKSKQ